MEGELCTFLRSCKEVLSSTTEPIIVIGNESADLDSVCCAIVLAMHLSTLHNKPYIPVVNVSKDIVAMRGEVVHVLGLFKLHLSDLIFIDDISHLLQTKTPNILLVDHNDVCLAWERRGFRCDIVGIVDHRADAGRHLAVELRIVEPCSSCASLLVMRMDICHPLLWYPLIWDSMNLTYRATPIDFQAAERLQSMFGLKGADTWRELEGAFAALPECDIPLNMLLLKDFKLFQNDNEYYGIPTIHIPLDPLDLNALDDAISQVMQKEDLRCLVICAAYRSAEQQASHDDYSFQQQVLIGHPQHIQMALFLNEHGELGLRQLKGSAGFSIWQQENVTKGRKQIQPVVARFLGSK